MATTVSSRVLPALVSGVATTAYYASPDVITTRTTRGWVKAGLVAVLLATAVPDARAALDRRRREHLKSEAVSETAGSTPAKVVAVGVGVVAIAGASAGGVAVERWIFRRGQGRAAAGQSWPHTRAALLLGVIAAGFALVPLPDAPTSSSTDG